MSGEGVNVGRAPLFDGTNYSYWKVRMGCFLEAMSLDVWRVVEYGFAAPRNPLAPTDVEVKNLQFNAQAKNALFGSLSLEVFNRVSNLSTAHEIWTTLREIHEGSSNVREAKMYVLKEQFDYFVMRPHETANEMFSRMNSIVNELKGLGLNLSNLEIVRRMLRVLPKEYKTLVVLLTNGDLNSLTPTALLGRLTAHELFLKEYEESPTSKKNIALKVKGDHDEDDSNHVGDDESEDSDDMALLMKKTRRLLKKFNEKGVDFDKRRRSSSSYLSNKKNPFANTICYECNEKGHIAARCENKKKKNKDTYKGKKKQDGKKMRFKKLNRNGKEEAYIGEWITDEESSEADSSDEDEGPTPPKGLAGLALTESTPPPPTSPFCFMATHDEKVHDSLPSYDELVEIIEELNTALGKEKQKFKVLKKMHTSLSTEFEEVIAKYEELELEHDSLLNKEFVVTKVDRGIACDLYPQQIATQACNVSIMVDSSTSCNDLISMPCSSKVDASPTCNIPSCGVASCATNLVKENLELKAKVDMLNKGLAKCYQGSTTLDRILGEQRFTLGKEGLGYVPKVVPKGGGWIRPKTKFVMEGNFCYKCHGEGHKPIACPLAKSSKNASTKSFIYDSHYLLQKGKDGTFVAKFIGVPMLNEKKKAIWVPKSLCTNPKGPKRIWVPKAKT